MNYFKINKTKENRDIKALIEKLRPHITPNTIIVNCSPDYSSIISQRVIHAYYDNPLQMVNFDMPFPNTEFELEYPDYCREFNYSMNRDKQYIFIDSGVLRGRNFKVLQESLTHYNYLFAALYVREDTIFTPDIYIEKFKGMLLFWWENVNCSLFD